MTHWGLGETNRPSIYSSLCLLLSCSSISLNLRHLSCQSRITHRISFITNLANLQLRLSYALRKNQEIRSHAENRPSTALSLITRCLPLPASSFNTTNTRVTFPTAFLISDLRHLSALTFLFMFQHYLSGPLTCRDCLPASSYSVQTSKTCLTSTVAVPILGLRPSDACRLSPYRSKARIIPCFHKTRSIHRHVLCSYLITYSLP